MMATRSSPFTMNALVFGWGEFVSRTRFGPAEMANAQFVLETVRFVAVTT